MNLNPGTRGENGIALPLAIIMVLLVSVVGAGLLTFVVSDLSSATQGKRGQQAFGVAEAGVEVARNHIRDCLITDASGSSCTWPSPGKEITVPDVGTATVTITGNVASGYTVTSAGVPSGSSTARRKVEAKLKGSATTTTTPVAGSTGSVRIPQMVYSLGGTNARETVLDGISLYSAGNLDFANGGKLTMKNASAFSGADIYFQNGSLSPLNILNPPLVTSGTDPFGNWRVCDSTTTPPQVFNCTARAVTTPGLGAVGRIKDKYANVQPSNMGSVNFDSTTSKKFVATPNPSGTSQPNTQITYPFDENVVPTSLDALMIDLKAQSRAQPRLLSASPTTNIAVSQGNYLEVNGSIQEVRICSGITGLAGCGSGGINVVWPAPTAEVPYPVVYVKFNGNNASGDGYSNRVRWSVLSQANVGTSLPPLTGLTHEQLCKVLRGDPILGLASIDVSKDGILVIENGDFVWEGAAGPVPLAPLDGGVIVKSGDSSGRSFLGRNASCVRGPVIADGGGIDLQNPALFGALPDVEFRKLPGFYIPPATTTTTVTSVQQNGWRERYD